MYNIYISVYGERIISHPCRGDAYYVFNVRAMLTGNT